MDCSCFKEAAVGLEVAVRVLSSGIIVSSPRTWDDKPWVELRSAVTGSEVDFQVARRNWEEETNNSFVPS